MGITKKQKEVLDYITEYLDDYGYSPTQNEIKEHFGLKSLGSVQRYIKYLMDGGHLESDANARRGLRPTSTEAQYHMSHMPTEIEIPLYGQVAAGSPIEAINDTNEMVSVPAHYIKKHQDYFALTVNGDSMIEDGIFDSDLIICKHQKEAQVGQTVIALINNEATVKKFYPKKSTIELHPANERLNPIVVNKSEVQIAGILVGLLRSYD